MNFTTFSLSTGVDFSPSLPLVCVCGGSTLGTGPRPLASGEFFTRELSQPADRDDLRADTLGPAHLDVCPICPPAHWPVTMMRACEECEKTFFLAPQHRPPQHLLRAHPRPSPPPSFTCVLSSAGSNLPTQRCPPPPPPSFWGLVPLAQSR